MNRADDTNKKQNQSKRALERAPIHFIVRESYKGTRNLSEIFADIIFAECCQNGAKQVPNQENL